MKTEMVFASTYFIFDNDKIILQNKKDSYKILNVSNVEEIRSKIKDFILLCQSDKNIYCNISIDINGKSIYRKIYLICNNITNIRSISYTENYKEKFETIFGNI